jgi:DNA-binding transcriptional ArsR family regulator
MAENDTERSTRGGLENRVRKLTEAGDLKALAHPLRMELLGHLVLHGPATATELADALGDSPSNCSWHLRKLAEHGFVEPVPDTRGRARPWQAVATGLSWEDDGDSDSGAAGRELTEALLSREVQRLRAFREAGDREPPEWRRAATVNQAAAWLTAEETAEVAEKLKELLLTPYFDRVTDPSRRPEGSRLVSLVGWVVPRHEGLPLAPGVDR